MHCVQSAPTWTSNTHASCIEADDGISSNVCAQNSKNQRGFQFILSVVDSATRYLWLLPLRHKTADAVATALYDDVITRVSVPLAILPSAILTDQGGELMGDVVKCLCKRLGIAQLRTSAYHPQTDAKCERVHYSVHNMITKLINLSGKSMRGGQICLVPLL